MDNLQLECSEGQIITLPYDGTISDGGILLGGNEHINESEMPMQILQGSSLMVPILVKTDQGQTFLISRQIMDEEQDESGTHFIITSGMETDRGEPVDGEMTNIDLSSIGYSLVDNSNLILSEESHVPVPQEVDPNSAPNLCIDVSQLNLVQSSNVMHFISNEDCNIVNSTTMEALAPIQGASLLKPFEVDTLKVSATNKDQLKRGRGRPKKEDADDIMEPPIGKGPFKCDQCTAEFDQWALMKRHKRIHLNERPFRCKECYASFNIESNLVLHTATHNLEDLQCPECHRRFTRVASLRSHLMLHEEEDNLICSECGEEFNLLAQLHSHMQKHEEEWVNKNAVRTHNCPHCGLNFHRISSLKEHIRHHLRVKTSLQHRKHKRNFDRSDFSHKCDTCQKQFQKPSQLLRHQRIHTGEKPFECEVCGRAFNQKGSLQVHMARHNGSKPYACDFCGARFSQKGNRRAHIQRVHSIPQSDAIAYRCSECTCIFRKLGSLNSHMGRAHSRADSGIKEDGTLKDNNVNVDQLVEDLVALGKAVNRETKAVESPNRDILQQAINRSGLEGRPADNIGAAKSTPDWRENSSTGYITLADKAADGTVRRYTIKQRKVGGVRWHQCSFCHKEFKKPSDLVRHIRTHTHEKPFKCQHCFRAFSVKSTLTAHQRTHQASLKVLCTICQKRFASTSSLKVHMRRHTGQSFTCRTCNESFPSSRLRLEHWATVCNGGGQEVEKKREAILQKMRRKKFISNGGESSLPEIVLQEPIVITNSGWAQHVPKAKISNDPLQRPYRCDRCGAGFRKTGHLKMHLRMHTGERPFKCPICKRGYISSVVLKAHMKTHELVKDFNCEVCFHTFSTAGSLKRHMLTHNESAIYMCPYCKKRFKNVINCKKHMKIHKPDIAMQVAQHLSTINTQGQRVIVSAVPDDGVFDDTQGNTIDFGALAESNADTNETVVATEHVVSSLNEDGGAGNIIVSTILEEPNMKITDPRNLPDNAATESGQPLEVTGSDPTGSLVVGNVPQLTLSIPEGSKPDAITSLAVISTDIPINIDGKENTDFGTVIFGQSFEPQSFDGCSFSTITVQGNPLEQTATIDAILQEETTDHGLVPNVELAPEVDDQNSVDRTAISDGEHLEEHRNTGLIKCNFCDEEFHRKPELRAHMISHKKYPCSQCDRILSTASAVKLHMKVHGRDKAFVCEKCNASFNNHQRLVRHSVVHSDDSKVFTCEKCAELFPSMNQLRQHLKMHNQSENGFFKTKKKNSQIQLSTEETLALVNREKEMPLSVSEQVLIASAAERDRISEVKDLNRSEAGPLHPNRCEYCPKSFRKPSDLIRHIRIHTGERPYRCDFCDRSFTVKSTLDSHYKTHIRGSQKLLPCHVCNLRFATKGSLKVHMRIHTGAKPFRCPICDQQFRTSGHRKAHIEMHERSARGVKIRSRKPRPPQLLHPEVHYAEEGQLIPEEMSAIESVQEGNNLVELAPDENVVAFDLQELVQTAGHDFQWQLTDSEGVPLDPGSLTQDILQQLQEQLQNKRMVVQNNGTVEFISMEEQHLAQALSEDQNDNIVVANDAINEGQEVTMEPLKEHQEGFPTMIEIANPPQHGSEMMGMPFEIHTDEHGEVVNIQHALESDGVMFSDIDIDLDTDTKPNLVALHQDTKFNVSRDTTKITESMASQSFDSLELPHSTEPKTSFQKKRSKLSKKKKQNAYQCPDAQCSKAFSKPSQLERHFRIHTGERPFQCNYCMKSFNQKNALMVHLKHHTGERPWPCPHCSHRFSQRGNLKTHLKRAHSFDLDKSQELNDSFIETSHSPAKKSKSAKTSKLSLLDDEDDIEKLGLSFFSR